LPNRLPGPVDLLAFDLDGTLIDSKLDLAHSVNAARDHLGLGPLDPELIYGYVGDGAPMLIKRALPEDATSQQRERALLFFLAYYREHMLDYTVLYPGVREALDRLYRAGKHLGILTNKPVRISIGIMAGLGLDLHFFRIFGGNSFEQKKPDPVGIHALCGEVKVPAQRTVMVGDSHVDILTARNAGCIACGVSWGFKPESFVEHPPDILIDDMRDLADLVLS
jgi:phosphoglycolate phosphatase